MDKKKARAIVQHEIREHREWFNQDESARLKHIYDRLEQTHFRYSAIAVQKFHDKNPEATIAVLVSKFFAGGFIEFLRGKNEKLIAHAVGLSGLNPEVVDKKSKFYAEYGRIYDQMIEDLELTYRKSIDPDDYVLSLYESGIRRYPSLKGAPHVLGGCEEWDSGSREDRAVLANMVEEIFIRITEASRTE